MDVSGKISKMEMHEYILNQVENYDYLEEVENAEFTKDITAHKKIIRRIEKYMFLYEKDIVYRDWYKKIEEHVKREEPTDFVTGLLKKSYQLRGYLLCLQNSKYKEKFAEAYFSTQPRKNIYSLLNVNKVHEGEFDLCYVTEKGAEEFGSRYIIDQLYESMKKHIVEIGLDEIKLDKDIVFYRKSGSLKNGMIIEISYPKIYNKNKIKEYMFTSKNALNMLSKIWGDITRKYGNLENGRDEFTDSRIIFDFQRIDNNDLKRVMRFFSWNKPKVTIYYC